MPQLSFLIVKVVDFFAVNSPVIKILRKLIKFLEMERENFNPGNAPIKRSGQSVIDPCQFSVIIKLILGLTKTL